MDYEPFKVSYTAGQPYVGATLSMYPPKGDNNLGNFIAWDAGTGKIWPNQFMVMDPAGNQVGVPGIHTVEPTFGLPATWVDAALKEEASLKGYTVVDAATVLSTHLTELLKSNMSDLLSYGEVQKLLKDLPKEQGELVKDIVPSQVTVSGIQRVLQLLLAERISIRDLRGSPARRRRELAVRSLFLAAASVSILVSGLIILSLVGEAWSFISRVDLALLVERGWFPRRDLYSIHTIVAGTLMVAGIGMVVAAPLGLGAAIYLSEYARERTRAILKPTLELLAGIPTVVYGYFALTFVTPMLRRVFPQTDIFNAGSAAIVVGIMIIPTIASLSEDALRAVPRALREGAFGLGATKLEVSLRVVVPAALSGIIASFILGISRAVGAPWRFFEHPSPYVSSHRRGMPVERQNVHELLP